MDVDTLKRAFDMKEESSLDERSRLYAVLKPEEET